MWVFPGVSIGEIRRVYFFYDEYTKTEVRITLEDGREIVRTKGIGRGVINDNFFQELQEEIDNG